MKEVLLKFLTPVRDDDLPALRQHLIRGAKVYGSVKAVVYLATLPLLALTEKGLTWRQVATTIIAIALFLLLLRRLRGTDAVRRPELSILGIVCVMIVGICFEGWSSTDGVSEDVVMLWAIPLALSAFIPWPPIYTFSLGAVTLAASALIHFGGIAQLTMPFARLTLLTIMATISGAAANQLQRLLWQAVENGRRQMAALDRLAGLGRLTAGIAHEVKTPIAATLNSLESARTLIDELRQSIGHAGVTEDDLHEIARELQAATNDAKTSTERVGRIIRGVREHTHGLHATSSVEFKVLDRLKAIEPLVSHRLQRSRGTLNLSGISPDARVRGDAGKFDQILLNLVVNAIEAGEAVGMGVIVRVATQAEPGGILVVSVQDDGPGLTPEVRARLFQPMVTTKPTGTGLGLAISRELAEGAFGGSLEYVPSAAGTRFELRCGHAAQAQAQAVFSPAMVARG